jgi:hypothetical protein
MMKTMGEWLGRTSAGSFDQDLTFGKKSKVFRKIAAVKAIRTRRILEHSQ